MPKIGKELLDVMKTYREKHFAIRVTDRRFPDYDGEFLVEVTRNGYQWYDHITMSPKEAIKIRNAINTKLRDLGIEDG